MATEKEENSPTEGPYDSERNPIDEMVESLEQLAQKAEAMLEMMEEVMEDVHKCESAYFCEPGSYVCTEPATEGVTLQQGDGLEIHLNLCLPCLNQLMKRHKELNE